MILKKMGGLETPNHIDYFLIPVVMITSITRQKLKINQLISQILL